MLNAMNVEIAIHEDNEVWELVELPPEAKTVGHKWFFKKKTDMDGAVHTYKARLVAKGFTQTPGIDYEETFSPVANIRAIRILIAIAAFYDYAIWQMDVKNSFLNGYLNEEICFLVYEKVIPNERLRVSCYTDAGYLTDADDMKSQTGYVFILNGGAIVWKSTKQSIFATSSIDAEYIAVFDASKEAVWIRKFIFGLGVVPMIEEPINRYCDNTGAIAIAKDHGVTKGTDNQEKDEKQRQNDKTGLGMEKTVKEKAKSKPESQSSQKVNRKVNPSQPRGQSQRNISLGAEIAKP
ncbi:retrotransposon protein, putative, ty1-copia subclass [Tanacetum coccineum]